MLLIKIKGKFSLVSWKKNGLLRVKVTFSLLGKHGPLCILEALSGWELAFGGA